MSDHRNDMPKTPQEPQSPKEWLKGEIIRAEVQRKAEGGYAPETTGDRTTVLC